MPNKGSRKCTLGVFMYSAMLYFSYALLSSVVSCKPERYESVLVPKTCNYVRNSDRTVVINQNLH